MKYNLLHTLGTCCVIALGCAGSAAAQSLQATTTPADQQATPTVTFAPPASTEQAPMVVFLDSQPVPAQPAATTAVDVPPPLVVPPPLAVPAPIALPPGILPANTEVSFTLAEELSSKTVEAGAIVAFTVANDVKLGDAIAIPKGSKGQAIVSERRKRGGFNKPGVLTLEVQSVTLSDGQIIDLSGAVVQEGKRTFLGSYESLKYNTEAILQTGRVVSGLGGVGIASAGLVAVGFLIKGDHAIMGTEVALTAQVKANTAINSLTAAANTETANAITANSSVSLTPEVAPSTSPGLAPVTANH